MDIFAVIDCYNARAIGCAVVVPYTTTEVAITTTAKPARTRLRSMRLWFLRRKGSLDNGRGSHDVETPNRYDLLLVSLTHVTVEVTLTLATSHATICIVNPPNPWLWHIQRLGWLYLRQRHQLRIYLRYLSLIKRWSAKPGNFTQTTIDVSLALTTLVATIY